MLDKLVESKSHHLEDKNRNRLFGLLSTFAVVGVIFAFVFSIFSYDLNLGSGDLSIASLTSPVMLDEPKPEPPAPVQKNTKNHHKTKAELPTRVENIQRVEEIPAELPDKISVTPSKFKERPNSPFRIGDRDFTPADYSYQNSEGRERDEGGLSANGIAGNSKRIIDNNEDDLPEVKKPVAQTPKENPKKEVETPKKETIVTGGVVNGKAIFLSQPNYSSSARAFGAKGKVEVKILIDENGRVTSASIISGHPLLRESALAAARKSVFSPTTLSGERVKVSGIIIYDFKAD